MITMTAHNSNVDRKRKCVVLDNSGATVPATMQSKTIEPPLRHLWSTFGASRAPRWPDAYGTPGLDTYWIEFRGNSPASFRMDINSIRVDEGYKWGVSNSSEDRSARSTACMGHCGRYGNTSQCRSWWVLSDQYSECHPIFTVVATWFRNTETSVNFRVSEGWAGKGVECSWC